MSQKNSFMNNSCIVTIIIVNYNGFSFLSDCFGSIKKLDFSNYEVIFVDNASLDGSAQFVKENFPEVKIIINQQNLGFSKANNQAAHIANGKFLFFLNNDTKIDSKCLSYLVNKMEQDNMVGIATCKIMSYDGKQYFHAGIGLDIFGFPVNLEPIFYSEGSALMIRKKIFYEIGGFDDAYFMFHEDVDLSWRAWLYGYRVIAVLDAVIYHYGGGSSGGRMEDKHYKSSLMRRYFSERNNIRTLLKNYSFFSLILILPLYLVINLCEILLFICTGKFNVSLCYIKSYWWNLLNLKNSLGLRARIQKMRKVPDTVILKKMQKKIGKVIVFRKVGIPDYC